MLDNVLVNVNRVNNEQRSVYYVITAAVDKYGLTEQSSGEETHNKQIYFLDGPSDTGNPFRLETFLGCHQSKIAIAVVSNGITATDRGTYATLYIQVIVQSGH